jgi:hypothetical protein
MACVARITAVVCLCILSACAGAGSRRISRRQLNQLAKRGDAFVMVFGSVKTREGDRDVTKLGKTAGAAIRFTHGERSSESVLQEIPISSGDRFYAVLKPPERAAYLDHFEAEVRWMNPAYDKLTYIRLPGHSNAFAMYMGEIEIQVARPPGGTRTSPKQILNVKVGDEFDRAAQELKRLYPKFTGELVRSPALHSLHPLSSAPPRH